MSKMKSIKTWWSSISTTQKIWIIGSTLAVLALGIIAGDTPINILIGVVGMAYVSVYSVGARGAFLMGVAYVSIYTVICLENRIYLDALQNIILIPIYIASYIHWGRHKVRPRNAETWQNVVFVLITVALGLLLYAVSKMLHGNYSALDASNTACTLMAMVLGYFGFSINWCMWSVNNLLSAITFGLCLGTPTGSVAVFAMKVIFFVNGIIGWVTWSRAEKCGLTE